MTVAGQTKQKFITKSHPVEAGILPNIATSIFGVSQEYFDFTLPGHGSEPYDDCGSWRKGKILVCPDFQKHLLEPKNNQTKLLLPNLDLTPEGHIEVEWHRRNCRRPGCPTCYEKWAGLEATKIDFRLKYIQKSLEKNSGHNRKYEIIHVIVSPPDKAWLNSDPEQLKKEAIKIAKNRRLIGGITIFHPWRRVCARCGCHPVETSQHYCPDCGYEFFKWYVSPHYHVLGFGWIQNTKEGYYKDGWLVKKVSNGNQERDVFKTAMYLLSHCGISQTHKRVATGFGVCSSAGKNAVIVPPPPKEKHICQHLGCQKELVAARFIGTLEQFEALEIEEKFQEYKHSKTTDPFLVSLDPSLIQIITPKFQRKKTQKPRCWVDINGLPNRW